MALCLAGSSGGATWVWAIVQGEASSAFYAPVLIVLLPPCIILTALMAVWGLGALIRDPPALIVDSSGVIDRTGPFGMGRLYWTEIGSASPGTYPRQVDMSVTNCAAVREGSTLAMVVAPRVG